jgi:dTDP-4-amino-4,6-dideoxygalactose transaminase
MAFIEKEAKNPEFCASPRNFTASGRAAFAHILAARKKADPRGILLPSYIGLSKVEGSGIFDPVRGSDMAHAFYRLDEHLVPDRTDLEKKLRTGAYQLVLLVHYFGCSQVDTESFVKLCHSHDAQVIEDCAHTLLGGLGERRLGNFGDYAIFSIHKTTSTRDGGFYYDLRGDTAVVPLAPDQKISLATLEAFARLEVRSLSEARARNYRIVETWVRDLPGLKLFFNEMPENAVPLNCPVIVNGVLRERLYFKLIEQDIWPTALYHTLIPEISRNDFPEAHRVSNSILNLPTHPDIRSDSLDRYEKALRKCVGEVFKG